MSIHLEVFLLKTDEGDDAIIEHDTSYCREVGTPLSHTQGPGGGEYLYIYYISKLVRALWLVNLAGRALPHSPLKF